MKNHIYSILLRRGISYEDGILGLKRKRETLRELHLPEIDRGLDMLVNIEEGGRSSRAYWRCVLSTIGYEGA